MADDTKHDEEHEDEVEETESGAEDSGDDEGARASDAGDDAASDGDDSDEDGETPAKLGVTKYVHAALFAAGMLTAYLSHKLLGAAWSSLTEWPAAVRAVPQLLRFGEDERASITLAAGAIIGLVAVIQVNRKPRMRDWADDVATELTKVTWPNRETVTNGTIVVVVASIIATVYIALLDKLWGFVTTMVYGA